MIVVFRLFYFCAAFLATAAGALVIASLFIASRAPQSAEFLGIHLTVGAVFLTVGIVLIGLQRHVSSIAALVCGEDRASAPELATHVRRLLAYLLVGGALLCVALGVMAYAILARIDQGFAVFG